MSKIIILIIVMIISSLIKAAKGAQNNKEKQKNKNIRINPRTSRYGNPAEMIKVNSTKDIVNPKTIGKDTIDKQETFFSGSLRFDSDEGIQKEGKQYKDYFTSDEKEDMCISEIEESVSIFGDSNGSIDLAKSIIMAEIIGPPRAIKKSIR